MLIIFGLLSGLEWLLFSDVVWPVRRPLAAGLAIGLAMVSGGLFGQRTSLLLAATLILSLYRIFNLLRLVQNRSEAHYLRQSALQTSVFLVSAQVALGGMWLVAESLTVPGLVGWYLLATLQLLTAAGLLYTTGRQLRKIMPVAAPEHLSDSQLPTLSVCIPARNETSALEECLRSLVASDYPKLEILVLDDCSQGGRTSDIIRTFAHDGVRFIQGSPPASKWLAKNWAYQQLFAGSNGALVLFCGVDIRFEAQSLRQIVNVQRTKHKVMQSIVPRNILPKISWLQRSLLIQPARYAWELCPPRRQFNRPPVLSSCWVAERSLISRAGGFAAVSGSISPEAYFAKRAITSDGYSFVAAAGELAVTSHKSASDQWNTAVRTRYPQLRKRPELVAAVSATEFGLLLTPLIICFVAVLQQHWMLAIITGSAQVVESLIYAQIIDFTYRRHLLRGLWLLPAAVLADIYIRHESMWRYEFGEVTWKGRNICLPVMRVIPRFPRV